MVRDESIHKCDAVSLKESLRYRYLEQRKTLTNLEVHEKSNQILKHLFSLKEFKKANAILFYISYDNEVSTHSIIKECLSTQKQIIVPITDKKRKTLILSHLLNWEELAPGAYGILEPKKEYIREVAIDRIDAIVVPGVVFDHSGHRIGHGKGYYDRLLRQPSQALRIGLAFECQVIDKIPVEKHDVRVNIIVTENRILQCSP